MTENPRSDDSTDELEDTIDAASLLTPSTYKTRGKTADAGATGVFGYATNSSGDGKGVVGQVDSTYESAAAVHGEAANSDNGASADGVVGITRGTGTTGGQISAPTNAYGVRGQATNSSGVNTYGVFGTNNGTGTGTAGVLGWSYSDDGQVYGVRGETNSDTDGAAGVWGDTNDSSGQTYGVKGTAGSGDFQAAGVFGLAPNGFADGVRGDASSGGGHGVRAKSNADGGYGVWATNYANSGNNAHGVYAETKSPDAAGVRAQNDNGGLSIDADGDVEVTGDVSMTNLGIDVYQSTDVSVNDTSTTIMFDKVRTDDLGEYDTSTGKFTAKRAGDFLVNVQLEWAGADAAEGDAYFLALWSNGTRYTVTSSTYSGQFGDATTVSYVFRGLSSGDTIYVKGDSNSSDGTTSVRGGEVYTWFQVSKMA